MRVKKAGSTGRDKAGDAMLCSAPVSHVEDSELYPKSSEDPLEISEQKGKIRSSFLKDCSGCWVGNEGYKCENQGTGEEAPQYAGERGEDSLHQGGGSGNGKNRDTI